MKAVGSVIAALCGSLACATAPLAPTSPTGIPSADRAAVDLCVGAGEPALRVTQHSVRLALSSNPPALAGTADVSLTALRGVPLVALDAVGLEVDAVAVLPLSSRGLDAQLSQGQRALRFETSAGRLCVDLGLSAGEAVQLRIHYRIDSQLAAARPAPSFGADQIWAGYQAAAWVPTLQDSSQRASLHLVLEAAPGWRLAGPPRALPALDEATGFHLDPAPPFLYGWAAGDFEGHTLLVDGVTLRALGPHGANLAAVNALTAPMLRFLTAKTGVRYPAGTYTQVFVKGSAAQEAAGLSFLAEGSIAEVEKDPTEDWIFIHELAHQWFGWLLPCADFADFWLNEGFATFMVAAYKEENWGRPAYDRELALWRARSDKVHAAGKDAPLSLSGPGGPFPPAAKGAPPRRGPKDSELQARGITYSRGALLLDKLRCDLGDKVFWDGISRYVKEGQGATPGSGGVRSDDLRVALEAASGRDLKALWAERVYGVFFDWGKSPACVLR